MADEAFETGAGLNVIHGGSEQLHDSDFEIVTLSVGGNTAKVGMAVTSTGETDPNVDVLAGGEIFRGLIIEPVLRPSDSWSPNDALVDGTSVKILKRTGGRALVWYLATGYDTPLAVLAGYPITNTEDSAITNDGVGDLFPDATETAGVQVIGYSAEDFTTGDSTSAANGKWQLMWL